MKGGVDLCKVRGYELNALRICVCKVNITLNNVNTNEHLAQKRHPSGLQSSKMAFDVCKNKLKVLEDKKSKLQIALEATVAKQTRMKNHVNEINDFMKNDKFVGNLNKEGAAMLKELSWPKLDSGARNRRIKSGNCAQ